jgi:hypothetical protein
LANGGPLLRQAEDEMTRRVACGILVALAAGCAWCPPLPGGDVDVLRPLSDVPPPPDCRLGWAQIHGGPGARRAVLVYVGGPRPDDVAEHYQREMPQENWAFVRKTTTGVTVLTYAKRGGAEHCDISIGRENWRGKRTIVVTIIGTNSQ